MPIEAAHGAGPERRQGTMACRRMGEGDIASAVALLCRGFPERTASYWWHALTRLRERPAREPHPRFGYVMTDGERLVGILLLIFSEGRDRQVFANVSSWYVDPPYRGYSNALLAFAFRMKDIVLFNISPTPSTIPTIEAQGFSCYCRGTFHALPALAPKVPGVQIREIGRHSDRTDLARLAAYGCRVFEVVEEGRAHAFAFVVRRFSRDRLPCAQLVYSPDLATFVRFAGPLGRRLLRYRLFSVMLDANGPIPGLVGRYMPDRRTKYFRGPVAPPLNDLRETELVIFGP